MNYQIFIAAVFGLFFGSFLNVVNIRFGQWKSIALTRSHCPRCKHELAWFENIPLISFAVQGGRCRHCHKTISWQYPIVELTTAIATGLIWYRLAPSGLVAIVQAILVIILAYLLILMSADDVKEMEVAQGLFTTAIVVAVLFVLVHPATIVSALLGVACAAVPLAVLVIISKERWMGWGDVWIAIPIGLILGYPVALVWLYGAFVIGAILGALLLMSGRKKRTDPVPFIPILFLSFMIAFVWGEQIVSWYLHQFLLQ